MQKLLGALTAATLFIAAYGDAVAFPVTVLKAAPGGDIVPVAQGCGPNRYRGTGRGLPFVWAWSLSRRLAWSLSRRLLGPRWGNGCPPGYWRGPWGHCRNTPFHGWHPDGSWY
jgi:hypothetical protein